LSISWASGGKDHGSFITYGLGQLVIKSERAIITTKGIIHRKLEIIGHLLIMLI